MKRLLAGFILIAFSSLGVWLLPARDQKNVSNDRAIPVPAKADFNTAVEIIAMVEEH